MFIIKRTLSGRVIHKANPIQLTFHGTANPLKVFLPESLLLLFLCGSESLCFLFTGQFIDPLDQFVGNHQHHSFIKTLQNEKADCKAGKEGEALKGILYARVSTRRMEQESSLDRQVEALTAWARRLGVEVVETITEQHSGFDLDRDGLYRLLDAIREKRVEAVLVQDDSRLGRGDAKLAIIHQLTRADCKIYSLQSGGELELEAGESTVLDIMARVEELQRRWMSKKFPGGCAGPSGRAIIRQKT
ncbi:resolvase family site-specific recombinase [Desmospora sp. 8437]|nr:resolvase family site-specific recombinase [Desmospora sp. 8437]